MRTKTIRVLSRGDAIQYLKEYARSIDRGKDRNRYSRISNRAAGRISQGVAALQKTFDRDVPGQWEIVEQYNGPKPEGTQLALIPDTEPQESGAVAAQADQQPEGGPRPLVAECTPDYVDPDGIIGDPEKLYKVDMAGGDRFYYTVSEDLQVERFVSVTTLLSRLHNENLERWKIQQGREYYTILSEMAEYGTFLHSVIAEFVLTGAIDLDRHALYKRVQEYTDKACPWLNPLHAYCESSQYRSSWVKLIGKDMLSWAAWAADYRPRFHAIELRLVSREMGVGGALDFIVEFEDRFCILDAKSTHTGFHDSHGYQLEIYRRMFLEQYELPDSKPLEIANWRPTAWCKKPGYEYKKRNPEKLSGVVDGLLQMLPSLFPEKETGRPSVSGVLRMYEDYSQNYHTHPLSDIVREYVKETRK